MNEIWKVIPSHPNYEASNTGFIRNKKRQRILKSKSIDNRQYQVVSIITEGKKYTKKVARLVWEAFNGYSCPLTIDHIDRNPSNDNISNLRCVSIKVNAQNRIKCNTKNKYNLTDETKSEIITKYIDGVASSWRLAHEYNIPLNYITTVINRGSWNKFYKQNDERNI